MDLHWPETSEFVALATDEAHVWAVRLQYGGTEDALTDILSTEEQERAAQLRMDTVRLRFTTTRAALRTILSRYLEVPAREIALEEEAHGKPRLARQYRSLQTHFNVAHSHDLALVAVTVDCEVGVDIERHRDVDHWEQIALRYFHDAEARAIVSSAPFARMNAFLKCWTAKEAVLKAFGAGLGGSLASFQVPIDDHNGQWLQVGDESGAPATQVWLQPLAPHTNYVGAIALIGQQRRVRCFAFKS
jgi:4'-phosphopantetheinyl transferase